MMLPRRQTVVVTIGLILCNMLAALDTSIVATAMPRIITELSGLAFYAWVTTAYLVTSTTIIPISGKLGDLFGRKTFLLGGIVGFLVTSVLCGVSQSMVQLVIARGLQGVFAGFLTSSVIASLADIYPPATRARLQGVFMSMFGFCAIAGPIIGGALTDTVGWRWVFFVNIPFGLVALTVAALTMPSAKTDGRLRDIDVRGALFLTACVVPFLTALTVMREGGLSSPVVVALLAIALVMLGAFVRTELRTPHPVMPFVLWRNPTFRVSVIVSFLVTFAMFGSNVFVPLLYQGLLGLTATQSGLYLMPRIIAMIAASLVSGQLVSRVERYRSIGLIGLASLATGLFLISQVTPRTSEAEVMRDLVLIGFGFGSNQPIWTNAVMSAVAHSFVGVASSQVQFWRSLGQTMGVTVFGAILATQVGQSLPDVEAISATAAPPDLAPLTQGLHLLFLAAGVASVGAMLVALTFKEVPMRKRAIKVEPVPTIAVEPAALGD